MEVTAGAGITQTGPQGAAEMLPQAIIRIGLTPPPEQGSANEDVGQDVEAIDRRGSEPGQQEAS